MKFIKIILYPSLLISCFLYGINVGRFQSFPFNSIQVLNYALKKPWRLKNDRLLAELAKTNNIELNKSPKVFKPNSSILSSDSLKLISFGDNEFKSMKGLLNSINDQNTSLIIHVGDTQNTDNPCSDSRTDLQRDLMNSLNAPVLYTIGDNEWLDCTDKYKGDKYNLERLAYIRETYFSKNRTLGLKPSNVENQSYRGYPENARLMIKNIAFITAHVLGEDNNFDPYRKKNNFEYFNRDQANIDWITKSFERYKEASAYVVAIHANVLFGKAGFLTYKDFASCLLELSNKYKKPVLLLVGDSHQFKAFQPLRSRFPFLHVIQNFGYPDKKAIEIEINLSKRIPFNVTKIIDD